jgi:hypothetical protein
MTILTHLDLTPAGPPCASFAASSAVMELQRYPARVHPLQGKYEPRRNPNGAGGP